MRRGADVVRFNTEDWPRETTIRWSDSDAELDLQGRRLRPSDIDAIWWRRPVTPVLPDRGDPAWTRWATRESREALDGFWQTTDAFWVNPPAADRAASNKPEQLRRAARHGLAVPETLITNDGEAAQAFAAHGPTICKPLSSGTVQAAEGERVFFTSLLDESATSALRSIGPEPYLLQRRIPKAFDVRVTVIGDEVFATRIDSQGDVQHEIAVDWRRGNALALAHSALELPGEVAAACVALTADYGLRFAAIDLACTPEGDYVFFEVNPSGQWAWLEQLTGLPLRARLADLLQGAGA